MRYCRRCAADLQGADICPACGTKVEEKPIEKREITFKPVPKQESPKFTLRNMIILAIIIIIILAAVKIIVFPYRDPPQNVIYSGIVEDNALYDVPIGIKGSIRNVAEDNKVIPISSIQFNVGGVVFDREYHYSLKDVITNINVTEINPGEIVEFYIELPEFKDQITVYESTKITYYVGLYYNNDFNDSETYNVAHLYE
ncbi:MAG: hypothetical protein KKH41_02965 [Candidatus Thermoplasmatota archaeon]|nr:hypothetical protein [Euryarchaeota archaeon]MBU4591525.1 hypothetical protein [Candidatus Thermoplasmatota archaeon]